MNTPDKSHPSDITPAPVPDDLVIEFHYADPDNVGAYYLEPSDSLYKHAREMWAQCSPRADAGPTHIVIRRSLSSD